MSMYEQQLQVLAILLKNLHNQQPQLVPTSAIAGEMNMQPPELRLLLSAMNAVGLIQTNSDLQYNLITRKGLSYLNERQAVVPGSSL